MEDIVRVYKASNKVLQSKDSLALTYLSAQLPKMGQKRTSREGRSVIGVGIANGNEVDVLRLGNSVQN